MKTILKQSIAVTIFLLFCSVVPSFSQEQQQNKQEKSTEAEDALEKAEKQATYLDIFHAKDKAPKLKNENLRKLYLLKIIVSNFGEGEVKGRFLKAQKNYKEGTASLYKRNYVKARIIFEQTKAELDNVLKLMVIQYQNRTKELLDKCADALVELELSNAATTKDPAESGRRLISSAAARLMIAYGQVADAEEMKNQKNSIYAIGHLRAAKYYGITILQDLAPDGVARNKIDEEYKIDFKDIKNLIADK